jgi:hypothetical protein
MRRLSVRRRDAGSFEVGPAGHGPTVVVAAPDRRVALKRGKALLRQKQLLGVAADLSYRDNVRINTRPAADRPALT